PQAFGEWAEASGKRFGYQVQVWEEEQIKEAGLHALLAVGGASHRRPIFIKAHYRPEGLPEGAPRVTLVGKGVTFDTGGISIKPSQNMHFMKTDMGGAAMSLGTLEAAARLQLPIEINVVVCSCENSVSATAIKPGDVIDTLSGQTIEVLNTDAEGRLILADGLYYAVQDTHPDYLINLATLTGSVVRTLGYDYAGLFSKNEKLIADLQKASEQSGDGVWRLPINDNHADELSSDVADLKNISHRPLAGASVAAKFLEYFTDNHPAWAHLDVAGTSFGNTPFSKEKNATGYGINLLITFLENLIAENA
ncbi:MAG: leucyl aminopeptidase family protein, partial [Bacteroidota bacterium]